MQPPPTSSEAPAPEETGVRARLPAPPASPSYRLATFRALRHRNYRLFFCGQLISLIGTWMQTTALTWLAFALAQQSKWPAWVSAALLLPTFLLGPWSGALADRLPKRPLLFWTQSALLVNALVLQELVLAGVASPAWLLAAALVNGLIQAVDLPTRLAFVMDMVGRADVANAVALNSLLFNAARLLGPLAAGAVLLYLGPAACFLLNAVSYLAVLIALLLMDVPGTTADPQASGILSLVSGFRYLWERPRLLAVVVVAGTTALTGWPFLALLPALAERALGVEGATGYSQMLSSTGLGALLAALTVATFGSERRRKPMIMAGVMLVSLSLVGLARAPNLSLAMTCCAAVGFGLILCFATSQAVVQLSSEPHNRGKLMGIWAMTLAGCAPLGNLVVGPAADRWGETLVLTLQGLACALAAVTIWLLSGFLHHPLDATYE